MSGSITKGARPVTAGALPSKEVAARSTASSKGRMGGGGAAGVAAVGAGATAGAEADGEALGSAGALGAGAAQASSKQAEQTKVQRETEFMVVCEIMFILQIGSCIGCHLRHQHQSLKRGIRNRPYFSGTACAGIGDLRQRGLPNRRVGECRHTVRSSAGPHRCWGWWVVPQDPSWWGHVLVRKNVARQWMRQRPPSQWVEHPNESVVYLWGRC